MATETKKIILILAGVAVLFLLLAGGIVWLVFEMTAEPVRVVRAHLEAINQNDYPRAYGYFSAGLKAELSQEEFQSLVEQNPGIFRTSDSTFSSRSIKNNVATLRGTLTGQQGQVTPVRYTLVKEGDQWLILGFRWGAGTAEED